MKQVLLCIVSLFIFSSLQAQKDPAASSSKDRLASFEKRKALNDQSYASQIEFKSVGPSIMGGRIVDLAVNPDDPTEFYAAYASGGLWYTKNNGTSFESIFDNQTVLTIGDIAVDWKENIIWIGTGENNSSRSSYAGVGMYQSKDGGATWIYKGLPESHHIGRIILHPTNPEVVWVAVLGHLYSPNKERGIYKTTDGGKTWNQTLFVNENCGGVDLIIHPENPNELYAAMWERTRRAWDFTEAGMGTGIYKSIDGGEQWTLVSGNGFPKGENIGRIGLDIYSKDGKTVVYAVLDNQNRRPKEKEEEGKEQLTKDDLRTMSAASFLKLEEEKIATFIKSNNYPKEEDFKVERILEKMKSGKLQPIALVEYLEDANSLLFDSPVVSAEVYRSDNQGKSWTKTHSDYLDDIFYSYGYYFGQIRVAPFNPDKIYIFGVPILKSEDGGKTFESIGKPNVHVDHHALWLNPKRDQHIINGNDGGVNISYDDGAAWVKCNTPPVGQFYSVNVDMAKPYNIYGGLQDNGVWTGSKNYRNENRWHNSGHYPYKSIMGGDGMQIEIDSRDNNTVYTGFQFGNYYRINKTTGEEEAIGPRHKLGERPLRFNWQTPIHLSVHNQDVLYMGSNKFHRSLQKGEDFETLSGDLTQGGRKGDVAYGTLTTIHESPLRFGLLYVGSDDGLVHVSKDGGYTWERITAGLPKDMWVTRVYASREKMSRVYLSLNGYRWDDFQSYVYVSEDYGKTWKRIGLDLPEEPVNVIKEDPVNANLVYVGTDNGLYVSLNKGQSFMGMNGGLPDAPVHDLVIHPRDKDIIIGTHGRSIYLANVEELQKLDQSVLAEQFHIFPIQSKRFSSRWGNSWSKWIPSNEPSVKIPVFLKEAGAVKMVVVTENGLQLYAETIDASKGINYLSYPLKVDANVVEEYTEYLNEGIEDVDDLTVIKEADNGTFYIQRGEYEIILEKGTLQKTTNLSIE